MFSANRNQNSDFDVKVLAVQEWDPVTDNVDVVVRFKDGRRYWGTFFTLENIRLLFEKNKLTGECRRGLYLWATDMIIVKSITLETIRETVAGLVEDGELEGALSRIDEEEQE